MRPTPCRQWCGSRLHPRHHSLCNLPRPHVPGASSSDHPLVIPWGENHQLEKGRGINTRPGKLRNNELENGPVEIVALPMKNSDYLL